MPRLRDLHLSPASGSTISVGGAALVLVIGVDRQNCGSVPVAFAFLVFALRPFGHSGQAFVQLDDPEVAQYVVVFRDDYRPVFKAGFQPGKLPQTATESGRR